MSIDDRKLCLYDFSTTVRPRFEPRLYYIMLSSFDIRITRVYSISIDVEYYFSCLNKY